MFDAMKTASPVLAMLFPLLTALLGIIAMVALIQRRYPQFIILIVLSILSLLTAVPFSSSIAPKPATSTKVSVPAHPDPTRSNPGTAETATSSPVPSATNVTEHLPWELIGFVLAIGFSIVVVAIALTFIVSHIQKKANSKSENLRAWKDVIKRHEDVRKQWASYEMDMSKIIDMPVMTDMREPVVIALHKALKTASGLAPKSLAKLAYSPVQDAAFFLAVNDLEVAFSSAEQEAKKIAWSKFNKEERKSLSTAKQLLSLAMDSGASPAERQAAYRRVFKELQGLIEFPEKARLEIESRHQLALAA